MKKIIAILSLLIVIGTVQFYRPIANAKESSYHPIPINANNHPLYIDSLFQKNGKIYITVDYIQWYEGDAANIIFNEREKDSGLTGAPDGYYIINDDKKLRTFEVMQDAGVFMQYFNHSGSIGDKEIIWNEQISIGKLLSLFHDSNNTSLKDYPYVATMNNGRITKIIQQFIP
ncbi:hypothetical protein EHS13_14985 [Paenibacillus psychroresistens]|uniref:Uncharacterized protein n=1 Tax=Paenibacillus psychroresistens TaxID=1778678 RepID=A0A6B8RJT4_9BACL|nr:hypothetical protein [Paenibacillus psychroresistens]QGQ96087.1 hypothetical protein EHS13_14985 [Paenibacillus psychroresistens]